MGKRRRRNRRLSAGLLMGLGGAGGALAGGAEAAEAAREGGAPGHAGTQDRDGGARDGANGTRGDGGPGSEQGKESAREGSQSPGEASGGGGLNEHAATRAASAMGNKGFQQAMAGIAPGAQGRTSGPPPGATAKDLPGSADPQPAAEEEHGQVEEAGLNRFAYKRRAMDAMRIGLGMWAKEVKITGVQLAGDQASGGRMDAPAFGPMISQLLPKDSPGEMRASLLLAEALDDAMRNWQGFFRAPGRPLFPGFANVEGPEAAPTKNEPFSLADVMPRSLHLVASTGTPDGDAALADAIGAINAYFGLWVKQRQVTGLVGKGRVPTFKHEDRGPVWDGHATLGPGGIS